MSLADVLARVTELAPAPSAPPVTAAAPMVRSASFGAVLGQSLQAATPGARALAAAEGEVGVAEQPPGSNDAPRIADYRAAVAGAQPGEPWCAYFASWAAAQAGTPLGDTGEGLGSVAAIADWAQRTGRYLPAGSTPQPGDLVLYGDSHVGLVESVAPDGTLTTVEGNYAQQVSRVTRAPGEPTGFVRLS